MKFHNITTNDMLNGEGLRTVLWVSGCEMKCEGCQNPETWDPDCGVDFDENAKQELFSYLEKPEISGLTLSGGHPLHENNLHAILKLVTEVRDKYPEKTIWLYTGYTFESIMVDSFMLHDLHKTMATTLSNICLRAEIVSKVDVLCDGPYIQNLNSPNKHWVGSVNQRVIDIKETLKNDFYHSISEISNEEPSSRRSRVIDALTKSIVLYNDKKAIEY